MAKAAGLPDMAATDELWGVVLAKVLGGAKPGELLIERPVKFDFALNVKTARALHLSVPNTVLLRAHRLIDENT